MATPRKKRTPRTSKFELYQGEYSQLLDEKALAVEAAVAEEASERRLAAKVRQRAGEGDEDEPERESMRLAAEYDALVAEAKKTAIVLELESPGRTKVGEIRDQHPPRNDEEAKEYGYNVDAFYEAIAPLCVKKPVYTADEWRELADTLSLAEWELLRQAIRDLISGVTQLPKSSLVSTLREMNAVESKSQQDGSSPRQRLTDGTSATTSTQ